jgi:hypothetical protein
MMSSWLPAFRDTNGASRTAAVIGAISECIKNRTGVCIN